MKKDSAMDPPATAGPNAKARWGLVGREKCIPTESIEITSFQLNALQFQRQIAMSSASISRLSVRTRFHCNIGGS